MKYASSAVVVKKLERSTSVARLLIMAGEARCAALGIAVRIAVRAAVCVAVRMAVRIAVCATLFVAVCAPISAHAGEVEVLHFWTSPGEAQSIAEIKALIAERGHTWKDFAVIGGGGQNAMAALRQRVLSGQPPASASIKGPAIQEWAAMGVLANLDAMAAFDHWDKVLPPVVKSHVKHNGHYVAVPVNIHRSNVVIGTATA